MIRIARELDTGARIGMMIVAAFLLAVFIGPLVLPISETEIVGPAYGPPTARNWLGTDNAGRDILARILAGGRMTVIISLLATIGSFLIGVPLGISTAVIGGRFDLIITRAVDALMAFPGLILALIVLSAIGTSIPSLIAMMAVLSSTIVFRLTRAVAADVAAMDYVEVARLLVTSDTYKRSSKARKDLETKDPENVFLASQNR